MVRINTARTGPIWPGDNEDVTSFTYLVNIVDTTGGTDHDQDIKNRDGKIQDNEYPSPENLELAGTIKTNKKLYNSYKAPAFFQIPC